MNHDECFNCANKNAIEKFQSINMLDGYLIVKTVRQCPSCGYEWIIEQKFALRLVDESWRIGNR